MQRHKPRSHWARAPRAALAGLAILVAGSCDFDVINPGPVPDEQLDEEGAHGALVEGARFSVSTALWETGYHGAEVTLEITRGGRNFCCPKVPPRKGEMTRDALSNSTWNASHQARFTAEDASRRFAEVVGEQEARSYGPNAETKLLAGFANRILGENMCTAVFDGGEPQPNEAYWERAEAAFTDAIEIGEAAGMSDIVIAAHAGRAQVRGFGLDDWTGAVDDAQEVPRDFTYEALYTSQDDSQYNILYDLGAGDPWRDWTVWDSDFEEYYEETGDPRVPWVERPELETQWELPLYEQQKYQSVSDNVNLASGREMILIEAEAELTQGNWQVAMDLINDLRSDLVSDHTEEPLPELEAENEEEAWTHLKDERRWELWLESRRMGDLRRWIENDVPGEMEDMSDRVRLCFPVAESELDTNDHLDRGWEDPTNPIYDGS